MVEQANSITAALDSEPRTACPARIFYIADFDPAGHGMPVPSWPPPTGVKTATASPVTSIPSTPPRTLRLCSGRAQGRLGSRQREYIGVDPEAQAAALARVKAWDELQAVKNEVHEVDHRLAAITGHLTPVPLFRIMGVGKIGGGVV